MMLMSHEVLRRIWSALLFGNRNGRGAVLVERLHPRRVTAKGMPAAVTAQQRQRGCPGLCFLGLDPVQQRRSALSADLQMARRILSCMRTMLNEVHINRTGRATRIQPQNCSIAIRTRPSAVRTCAARYAASRR